MNCLWIFYGGCCCVASQPAAHESKIISNEALTNLETSYIKTFDFSTLYNFKKDATSSLGYQHTEEAKAKMVEYYKDKTNHPMYGKTPTPPHPPPHYEVAGRGKW